ncbi:unnamed protein product [Mycena citricolor]|uniref:Oxidoreductase n=1 Tax=Mycena citricolor TaxID=2018698 RepID=A0AAD2JWN2_9AGAR|nr:unnamed protein product [Mycena citricolor]
MAPIRTALIGLSANAPTSWAPSAHLPYLLSAHGRSRYTIVAILNSSKDSALEAIKHYDLPVDARAYGSPEELAADADVQLVVCCTRVDKHFGTVLASVKAGKDAFVEWPLAHDVQHAKQLADAAKAAGGRTMVGFQGRVGSLPLKLKEIIEEGRIGKVLSTELRVSGGTYERDIIPSTFEYVMKRSYGGTIVTIFGGHLFDIVQHVLGEAADITPHLQLQRPISHVRDAVTNAITHTVESDVPDLFIVTSRIAQSSTVVRDASLLFRFRRGPPFPGEPSLVWTITGEQGEIRVTNQAAFTLHITAEGVDVELHDFKTDKVEKIDCGPSESWPEDPNTPVPVFGKHVGLLYERFASGGEITTWDDAVKRHEQIDAFTAGWNA